MPTNQGLYRRFPVAPAVADSGRLTVENGTEPLRQLPTYPGPTLDVASTSHPPPEGSPCEGGLA